MAWRSLRSCCSYSVGGSTGLGKAAAGEPLTRAALPPQAHRTSNRATASPGFRMARDYVTRAAGPRRVKPTHRRLGLIADARHGLTRHDEPWDRGERSEAFETNQPRSADSRRACAEPRISAVASSRVNP